MCSVGTHSDCSDLQVQGRLKETKVMGWEGRWWGVGEGRRGEGSGRCDGDWERREVRVTGRCGGSGKGEDKS